MVHKVNNVEFLKIGHLLIKSFTQNFKKRYCQKRKSQWSNLKIYLPEKAPKEKFPKEISSHESFNFSELLGLQKLHFPLKDYTDGYFWLSLEGHFLRGFFPHFFIFLRSRRKYTNGKPCRNLVNENSSKIRRNTRPQKRWKNYGKRRQLQTYTKSAKFACYPIVKIHS